jgi:ferredoxin-NADP reductase
LLDSYLIQKKYLKNQKNWWRVLFISAGIGITPFISMIRSLIKTKKIISNDENEIILPSIKIIHSEKEIKNICFLNELLDYHEKNLIDFSIAITKTLSSDFSILEDINNKNSVLKKLKYFKFGRIDKDFIKNFITDIENRIVYLCGPSLFMKNVTMLLEELNVPNEHILCESFDF